MAGTSQSGAQVGRRKPVIQGGPVWEILKESPGSGYGRVCEVTSGGFVEAKQEKRWLAIGPLWSDLADRNGSGPANQSPELVARNLPVELYCQTTDLGLGRAVSKLKCDTADEI